MNMKQTHQEAMAAMQEAIVLRAQGNDEAANTLFAKAFELEKQAALTLLTDFDNEPTRSVLFRSAASLAMNCKKYREAEKLAAQGLAGDPPQKLMAELRELYRQISTHLYAEVA